MGRQRPQRELFIGPEEATEQEGLSATVCSHFRSLSNCPVELCPPSSSVLPPTVSIFLRGHLLKACPGGQGKFKVACKRRKSSRSPCNTFSIPVHLLPLPHDSSNKKALWRQVLHLLGHDEMLLNVLTWPRWPILLQRTPKHYQPEETGSLSQEVSEIFPN